MTTIAFILDGAPSDAELFRHGLRCVFVSGGAMFFSWILARRQRHSLPIAMILGCVSALMILGPSYNLINWGYPFTPPKWLKVIPWVAAVLPFVVTVYLYFGPKPPPHGLQNRVVDRSLVWLAWAAPVIGLYWLYSDFLTIRLTDEVKFIACVTALAIICCCGAVFLVRGIGRPSRTANQRR